MERGNLLNETVVDDSGLHGLLVFLGLSLVLQVILDLRAHRHVAAGARDRSTSCRSC